MSNQELLNKILSIIPNNFKITHKISENTIMIVIERNNKIILQVTKFHSRIILKENINGSFRNYDNINNNTEIYDIIKNILKI